MGYLKLNRNQFAYNTTTWNINAKKILNRMEYKKRIITWKEKLKILTTNNNKNKNKRVIYER